MCRRSPRFQPPGRRLVSVLLAAHLLHGAAAAAPVLGFRETFPGTSTQSWGGGATGAVITNPGSGGYFGSGDGYLQIVTSTPNRWGAVSFGSQYTGDWIAAGVTQLRVWLNDIGNLDPLEVHFSIGKAGNFWQYDVAFLPPHQSWAEFVVDLTSPSSFSQIIDQPGGTFADALRAVDRIHFRHDRPPFMQVPDSIQADGGIDQLLLTDGLVGVGPGAPTVARPLRLAPPVPNPSRGPVTLAFESFEPSAVRIEIVDLAGRRVRSAELPAAGTGWRSWLLDGRDDGGGSLAPGVYRVRVADAAGGESRALVRVN